MMKLSPMQMLKRKERDQGQACGGDGKVWAGQENSGSMRVKTKGKEPEQGSVNFFFSFLFFFLFFFFSKLFLKGPECKHFKLCGPRSKFSLCTPPLHPRGRAR